MNSRYSQSSTLSRILSWPSHYLFLICFLLGGVLLCAGSFLLHIGSLQSAGSAPFSCKADPACHQREVGYLSAPNWSLTYAILGPLALTLMLESLKGLRGALDYLFKAEMVRDEEMRPLTGRLSSLAWEAGTPSRRWFLVICGLLIPAGFAYSEWYRNNFLRLRGGGCAKCNPSDYDWGLSAIMTGTGGTTNWHANAAFDFLAFTAEAFLIGGAVVCFLYLLDLAQVVPGPDNRVTGLLLPNLRSADPRRGFEKFEKPLQLMLNASLVFFLICYSIRVNRVYMRTADFSSIGGFLQGDINGLVKSKVIESKGSELLSVLFTSPPGASWQDFLGGIALFLVSLFSLSVIFLTVGSAAQRAKESASEYYEHKGSVSLFGLSIEDEKKRLDKMTTWPLEWRYFKLDALLAIMLIALLSLWFYKIGFYIVLLVTATLLTRFRKAIGADKSESDTEDSKKSDKPANQAPENV